MERNERINGATNERKSKRADERFGRRTDRGTITCSNKPQVLIIVKETFLRLYFQRMRKIKPFKLADVTRILNPEERQRMLTAAVNRILAAESE